MVPLPALAACVSNGVHTASIGAPGCVAQSTMRSFCIMREAPISASSAS